jgi:hypothetical protein
MTPRFVSFLAAALSLVALFVSNAEAGNNLASTVFPERAAEEILKTDVEAASGNAQPDITSAKTLISYCSYKTKTGKTNAAHIDVTVRKSETPEDAKAQFDSGKLIYRGQDLSGIGDAAFRSTSPPQLMVLKGKYWIMVTAGTFKPDPALEESAASEILRRLRD